MFFKKILKSITVVFVLLVIIVLAYNMVGSGSEDTVTIGYLPTDHDAALFVANATKMYEAEGITVELHEYNNGGDLMSAMASGYIDVGYVGITPTVSAMSKGVPIKIVAGAQNEGSGIVTNDASIKTINDFKGKTLATPGQSSIQYMLLVYELKQNNMSTSDVEIPGMKVSAMNDALMQGSIDGMLTYEPYVSISEELNNATVVETSGEIIEDHPCCVVVMRDNFINNRHDTAKKMVDIHKNATKKLEANSSNCEQYMPRTIVRDSDVEKTSLSNLKWASDLNDTYKQNIRNFINIEHDLGVLNNTFTDNQLFYEFET